MNRFRVFFALVPFGLTQELHAMAYVDPASAGTLMRVLAPLFILASVLGLQFKHRLVGLFRRLFQRSNPEEKGK